MLALGTKCTNHMIQNGCSHVGPGSRGYRIGDRSQWSNQRKRKATLPYVIRRHEYGAFHSLVQELAEQVSHCDCLHTACNYCNTCVWMWVCACVCVYRRVAFPCHVTGIMPGFCIFINVWLQKPGYKHWLRKDGINKWKAFCTMCKTLITTAATGEAIISQGKGTAPVTPGLRPGYELDMTESERGWNWGGIAERMYHWS